MLGANEIGFGAATTIRDRLQEATDIQSRLSILERELAALLDDTHHTPKIFRLHFKVLKNSDNPQQIAGFCKHNGTSVRTLERWYAKYVGVSPRSYGMLNRFQNSINQLNRNDYQILTDVAYGNGYYDQTHFIKAFVRYTGETPKSYLRQQKSMLQVGKMS